MTNAVIRPIPRATELTKPFWDATADRQFLIQRCQSCGEAIFYPRASCPVCGSLDLGWEPASGYATVFTYTIARRATHQAFAEAVPYVIAVVELEEGPRVTTNIVDCEPDAVTIDMPVELTFADEVDGVRIPLFRPRSG